MLKRLRKLKERKMKPYESLQLIRCQLNRPCLFLKELAGPGMISPTQTPVNPPVANNIPKPVGQGGNDAFCYPLVGAMTINNKHDMLTKFLKLKRPIFHCLETKDNYEFIVDCYGGCIGWVSFTNMELSSCPLNFKMRPSNGGEFTWNAETLHYLHLLGPKFMPYSQKSMC